MLVSGDCHQNFKSGHILRGLALLHYDRFQPRSKKLPKLLSFSSGCTGTGIESHVFDAVTFALQQKGWSITCQRGHMCEKAIAKQNFLMEWECKDEKGEWLDPSLRPCLFADMQMLREPKAFCLAHSATEQRKVVGHKELNNPPNPGQVVTLLF